MARGFVGWNREALCAWVFALIMLSAAPLPARIIITEIIPGVNTTATAGDTVELYNTGPGAVDLTGWILSDLDPASVETDPTTELSFAPLAIGLPPLQPGEFAVIIFTLDTGTAGFIDTNFGLRVTAPLLVSGGMFDATWEQLVLFDDATPTPVAIDSVVWRDDGGPPSNLADTLDDLAALTPATQPAGFTFTLSVDGRWSGPDAIPDQATYSANAIDFTGWTAVSTYGGGVLRRVSVGNIFSEGAPDGPAQWQAVDRTDATLGNFSGLVPAPGGFLPILETDDITVRVIALKSSNHPERRIDTAQDVNRFTEPSAGDITAWRAVMAAANDQQWVDVFGLAEPLGYELVEFLDIATGATFHILQEEVEPGDPGYRGLGIFVLDASPGVDPNLVLQAPHPIHDSLTLDELGLAIPQLRPRASLIAGTHRKNHTTETTCDGTFEDNSKYRISDVAHHTQNFFEPAHEELEAAVANTCVIQFHGFCGCNYPALTHDAVVSNGVGAPALSAAARVIAARIDAQNFIADDGLGGDQTTAAIFGVDTASLGATNNLQGRITNFVAAGDICDTAAVAASERFIHIEQDLDVREEPQHIIDAIAEAIAIIKSVATPSPTSTATPTPSATASQTPSPTPSRTPTAINSPTSSVTPSPTPSGTASPTPSATITPTASATPSVTAPSRTPTPSPSTTPTASASSTSSPSTSPTPSPTVTISATSSPTAPANAALDWEIYQ